MSKTNDTAKLGRAPQVRELRDDELQEVTGGGGLNAGSNEVEAAVIRQKKHVTKFKFEPTSFDFG